MPVSSFYLEKNETNQCGGHYSSYFADGEIRAQRGSETCSRWHSQKSAEPSGESAASPARHVCFITGQVTTWPSAGSSLETSNHPSVTC